MFNSKYSKTLTVILIIVIILIVGLLIFFGIDVYRKYYIEEAAGNAYEQFQNSVANNTITKPLENETVLNDVTPDVDVNEIYQNTTNSGQNNSSSGSGVTHMGFDVIGTIEIPATDVKYPIIPEYQNGLKALNVGIVVLYPAGDKINQVGNTVFAGHNYRNGTFFSNNKKLQKGDKIYITDTSGEKVTYVITKKYETDTGDSSYMNRDTNGKREISLTTCTDDTKKRLIIWAEEA